MTASDPAKAPPDFERFDKLEAQALSHARRALA
jgi:hypothetical protein